MTIKDFLKTLKFLPDDAIIAGIDKEHSGSDRGSYYDFCLYEDTDKDITVIDLRRYFTEVVLNYSFPGYKGGEYEMNENTTLKYGIPEFSGKEVDGLLLNENGIQIKTFEYING